MRPTLIVFIFSALLVAQEAAGQTAAAIAYAPTVQVCPPGTTLVREVGSSPRDQSLSAGEAQYVSARQSRVLARAWGDYLSTVQSTANSDLPEYVSALLSGAHGPDAFPTLGIATSGGGYRAAIFGAGVLNALDGRSQTSVRAGTGGLLQTATYLSGLSGGSWLVSSLAQADFPPLPELVFGTTADGGFGGWLTEIDFLQPGPDAVADQEYVAELLQEIAVKRAKGFPVSITDVWSRALGRHFVDGTTAANFFDNGALHGAGLTFSSITNLPTFSDFAQPFPIVISNSLTSRASGSSTTEPGETVPLSNPIYEFNVFETGSFDPMLGAFIPTEFLGSQNSSVCVTGFDQVSFVESASSNLFNAFNVTEAVLEASVVGPIIDAIQQLFPQPGIRVDSAVVPNPFMGVSSATFPDADQTMLTLVDGGEDGEVTPFQPLLVEARGVDTIIAIDASADTADNWSAGLSLVATQDRAQLFPAAYPFPRVPSSSADFLAQNLTQRATFFGCESASGARDPLVVYIANGGAPLGAAPLTNTSTLQLQYPAGEVQAMLDQVFDVATQGFPVGGAKDPEWPACLACAVVDRARRRAGVERSGVCESCLERYCWS